VEWGMVLQDREKTMKEIQTFLDTKIAPKEFASELKVLPTLLACSFSFFTQPAGFNQYLAGGIDGNIF